LGWAPVCAAARRPHSFPPPQNIPSPSLQAAGSEALRTLLTLNAYENRQLLQQQLDPSSSSSSPTPNPSSSSSLLPAARPRLVLPGLTPPTAGAVLRFLYTGRVKLELATSVDVLLAAERFGLSALRQLAERHLPRVLREENACAILAAAHAARVPSLVHVATAYVLRHMDGILDAVGSLGAQQPVPPAQHGAAAGFLALPRPLLALVLLHDDLVVASEEKLLYGVIRWGLANLPTGARSYSGEAGGAAAAAAAAGVVLPAAAGSYGSAGLSAAALGGGALSLPPVPVSAVPGLRALLTDVVSGVRFAFIDVNVLRSPVIAAMVPPELILGAMFEKVTVDRERERVLAGGAYTPPPPAAMAPVPAQLLYAQATAASHGFPAAPPTAAPSSSSSSFGVPSLPVASTPVRPPAPSAFEGTPRILSVSSMLDGYGSGSSATNAYVSGLGGASSSSSSSSSSSASSSSRSAVSSYIASRPDMVGVGGPAGGAAATADLLLASPRPSRLVAPGIVSSSTASSLSRYAALSASTPSSAAPSYESAYYSSSSSSSSSSSLSSIPPMAAPASASASVTNARTGSRRYATLSQRPTPGGWRISPELPSGVRFDAYLMGTALLGNSGKSAAFAGPAAGAVAKGAGGGARRSAAAALAASSGSDGSRGGVLVSIIPAMGVPATAAAAAVSAATGVVPAAFSAAREPILPPGLHSFDVVLEDAVALLDVDPESFALHGQPAQSAADIALPASAAAALALGGGIVPAGTPLPGPATAPLAAAPSSSSSSAVSLDAPFELALCLLPAGSAHASLVSGLRAADPAAYGAVWCATNRGHVFVIGGGPTPSATAAHPAASSVPLPLEMGTPIVPEGMHTAPPPAPPLLNAEADKAASASAPAPAAPATLSFAASGAPFGVNSYVTVAVDTVTGDVGLAISTARCNFAEEDDGDDEEDGEEEDADQRILDGAQAPADSAVDGPPPKGSSSTVSAPRAPPAPFALVSRVSLVSAAAVGGEASSASASAPASVNSLHCPDPSLGPRARLHAVATRLHQSVLDRLAGGGLQLAVLARSTEGLVVTLVPPQ
jgi:hypothetical protein